jgi:hypothetical protein
MILFFGTFLVSFVYRNKENRHPVSRWGRVGLWIGVISPGSMAVWELQGGFFMKVWEP